MHVTVRHSTQQKLILLFFFLVHAVYFSEYRLRSIICFCGVFFTRNFFGWEIFSDLHCQKIRSSCFDISLKMWRQTRLVIIAVILVGFFFNLCDLWQIHSNQETRHLFGVKTKMSRFVIDFEGLAYTDKMNAINRFQCSSWASPILAMAIFFFKNWRDDIQMWRKLNFWWPLKCKFFLVIVFLLPTRLFIRSLCVHSITGNLASL